MTRRDRLASTLLKIYRNSPRAFRRDPLQERAELAARIVAGSVAGRIVVRSGGTDCDGCSSEGLSILPAIPVVFERYRDRHHADAEGPSHCYVLASPEREDFEAAYDAALPSLTGWDLAAYREAEEYERAA